MKQSNLLKAALIGTNSNSSHVGEPLHEQLQTTWQALTAHSDQAVALLQAAALEQSAWRAGVTTEHAALPEACPDETKAFVSSAAATAAIDLMHGDFQHFLIEWITIAQQHGLVATPRLLPGLFKYGELHPSARLAIADIAGTRGHWLANKTNKWTWIAVGTTASNNIGGENRDENGDDTVWQTGTPVQRHIWLQQQLKHHPEKAADAISEAWPAESPDSRETFTQLVALHPHAAHEAWLQQRAVIDRRQSTRYYAAGTLMNIPASGFRKRSLQRAAALLSSGKKLSNKNQITCHPPTQYNSDWAQDGIREKPPTGTGQKAYWMQQILSLVPLQEWPRILDIANPFAMQIDADWSATVLQGWQQAAKVHPDSTSLTLLLQRLSDNVVEKAHWSSFASLLDAIEQDDFADTLEQLNVPDEWCLPLLIKRRPALSVERHPTLHKTASNWMVSEHTMFRPDAIALAGCCDQQAIPSLLAKISKLAELSEAAEEFARALEHRQSYLKHFFPTATEKP